MRAEPRTTCVAGSARPVRGRLNRVASARPEILVASSTGPAADCGAESTLRVFVIELDAHVHADARSLARSTRYRTDIAVQRHIASTTSVTGHCAIAVPTTVTSSARHPLIGHDHLRPADPAGHPRRLTDRQLTPAG